MKPAEKTNIGQLDILRGLAIVLMVINHAGIALLGPALQHVPIVIVSIFIGSFAPVLFFFTTGFGVGIARAGVSLRDFRSTAVKALLLIVADQFFFWKIGAPFGLDFLSFIAISTLLVTAVAAHRRPVRLSFILIVALLAIRFVLGPLLRQRLPPMSVLDWIIGIRAVDGVSYPLSPWMIYPLLGFIMARHYQSCGGKVARFFWPWPAAVALAAMAFSVALSLVGATFFRWGTMSFAFFMISIVAICASMIAAWGLHSALPRASGLISLRGIASLAVVPIHYALIELLVTLQLTPQSVLQSAAMGTALIALTVLLARTFAGSIRIWMSRTSVIAGGSLVFLTVLSGILLWVATLDVHALLACVVVGQLAIAGLLSARNPSRRMTSAERSIQVGG